MKYLNIALPKGRLADLSVRLFESTGIDCSGFGKDSRNLIISDGESGIRFFLVKPADVPTYVEYGAADIGIAGKDTLMEEARDLYEVLDLGFAKCRMILAAQGSVPPGSAASDSLSPGSGGLSAAATSPSVPSSASSSPSAASPAAMSPLSSDSQYDPGLLPLDAASLRDRLDRMSRKRVATKYPRIARTYFEQKWSETVEVIQLSGSVELAPLVGLSEFIVDLVETGRTLRDNGLIVLDDIAEISARLVVNRVSMKMESARIGRLIETLRKQLTME